MEKYAKRIAEELHLTEEQVKNTLELLEGGATIPFVARYRKEATGSWTNGAPPFWIPFVSKENSLPNWRQKSTRC